MAGDTRSSIRLSKTWTTTDYRAPCAAISSNTEWEQQDSNLRSPEAARLQRAGIAAHPCSRLSRCSLQSDRWDSNPQPPPWQGSALPTELRSHISKPRTGLEPITSCLRNTRSANMSYRGTQARRDSNPQPTVLETVALPVELLTFDPIRCLQSPRDFSTPKTPKAGSSFEPGLR